MPDASHLLLFLAAAFLLAITPGPGIFYVAARSLAGGRAEGVASSLGTGLGGLVHVLAGALGVSALLLASAELFTGLKLVGAAYLIWIGCRTLHAARREGVDALSDTTAANIGIPQVGSQKAGAWRAFRDGACVEVLNPKTAAFFLAFIPHFIPTETGSAAAVFGLLGTLSVLLNTLVDVLIACAASRLRVGAHAHPTRIRRLREASGVGMVALGVGLALAKRPTT